MAAELADDLVEQCLSRLAGRPDGSFALIGATPEALAVRGRFATIGMTDRITGIFDPDNTGDLPGQRAWHELGQAGATVLVICADADKQRLLRACAETFDGTPSLPVVVLAGAAHLEFSDPDYALLDAPALVPSYATGYPLTRVHLYQCLKGASEHKLSGAVVEFGAFKAGTTVWLARVVEHLDLDAEVIGFDTWAGFPERRSLLDLYEHPRCVFSDLDAARAYAEPHGVTLVAGDITETCETLRDRPILLAFVDTDNYSAARAALAVCAPNVVAGGSVVLDHYWTTPDYVYTVGERLAADETLHGQGFLHLHGTGVFTKLAPATS